MNKNWSDCQNIAQGLLYLQQFVKRVCVFVLRKWNANNARSIDVYLEELTQETECKCYCTEDEFSFSETNKYSKSLNLVINDGFGD